MVATKRDQATDGVGQQLLSFPNTRRQKSAGVAAPVSKPAVSKPAVSKPSPNCSHDKHLRYLPTSTLGSHAGGGI